MPCAAKKEEILRPESSTNGKQDIDYVLTTTELIGMIRKAGIRFENLEIEATDMPFVIGSGAGVIFGVTGGVTEAVLRRLREGHNRVEMEKIKFSGVRGEEGIKEVEFDYNGCTIRVAVVSGLGNADSRYRWIRRVGLREARASTIRTSTRRLRSPMKTHWFSRCTMAC